MYLLLQIEFGRARNVLFELILYIAIKSESFSVFLCRVYLGMENPPRIVSRQHHVDTT